MGDVRRFRPISDVEYPLYVVCTEDAQEVANDLLGRELTDEELSELRDSLCLDWRSEIEHILVDDWKLQDQSARDQQPNHSSNKMD